MGNDGKKGAAGRKLAYSVSLLALMLVVGSASQSLAQTPAAPAADNEDIDTIVVTGVRAAISRSMRLKRNADSIIDGVSAEDMGKFPDANVAESLQRIPGVSIDRQGGEGRFVSINGLGSEFSSVLVNGRPVANDNPDRSFSFDTIASELVSGVKVYKSANAKVPEGGIGGTIDVVTARPFDYPGFKFAGSISSLYEENADTSKPQISFIASDRFMNGKLGILASLTRQERNSRTYSVTNSAIIENVFFDPAYYAYVADDHEGGAWRMQDLSRLVTDEKRVRTGGTLAVQFRPNDSWLFTTDYLYSNFEVKTEVDSTMNWFWNVQDNSRNVYDAHGTLTTFDHGVGMPVAGYAYIRQEQYRPTETHLLGFNTRWTPNDKLTGEFDISWSSAINNNRGLDRDYTLEVLNQPGFLVHSDGGVPWIDDAGSYQPDASNESLLRARINSNSGTYVKSVNQQVKADFAYTVDENLWFNFGASYTKMAKDNEFWQTPIEIRRMYHANAMGQVIDTASIVRGIMRPGDVFGNPKLNGDMFLIDGDALRVWMADPVNLANRTNNATAGGLQEFIANGRSWNAVPTGDEYEITEKATSVYVDTHWKTSVYGMPLSVVAGLRYSKTEQQSDGRTRIMTDLYRAVCGTDWCEPSGVLTPVYSTTELARITAENTYSRWLPSLNAKLDLTDNMVVRMSMSQTMTRPILEDLAPQIKYRTLMAAGRTATASNPNLKPFFSTNFDLSYEWYYQRDGALAIAYFHKDIKDFIYSDAADELITTISSPTYQLFSVTRPRNAEEARIDGLTFSWIHTFDMGLGFQANYTKVDSNVADIASSGTNFAVPGLSDTANLVAFYEKGGFGARLAYNWRDTFLAQPRYAGTLEPRYYKAYSQLDARLSYGFDSGTVIALEGVNLTGETVSSHGRYESQFISYADYGRRFTISVSQKF